MDDNYFDKKIKKILKSPPVYEPDDSAIKDMQRRLRQDGQANNRPFNWWPLLLSLVLLFLLLGSGWFFHKYTEAQGQLERISTRLSALENRKTKHTQHTIYQYDTIYRTVYQYIYPEGQPTGGLSSSVGPGFPVLAPGRYSPLLLSSEGIGQQGRFLPQLHIGNGIGWNRQQHLNENQIGTQNESTEPLPSISDWLYPLAALPISMLDTRSEYFTDLPLEANEGKLKVNVPRRKTIRYFIPRGFRLCVSGSPYLIWPSSLHESAYSLGLSASVEFPEERSLDLGVEIMDTKFEIKDSEQFSNYPVVPPDDPGDILHELKGYVNYLQIPVTLSQRFRQGKALQPFLYAGVVAHRPLQQRFVYEYIRGFEEYKLRTTLNEGRFSFENVRLGGGMAYTLGQRFDFRTELFIQRSLEDDEKPYSKLNYWAFRLGAGYQF